MSTEPPFRTITIEERDALLIAAALMALRETAAARLRLTQVEAIDRLLDVLDLAAQR